MGEPDRVRLTRVLTELQAAIAADRGAALYLDDGDAALTLAASAGALTNAPPPWHRRLFHRDNNEGRLLMVPVPDAGGGVIVLERSTGSDFTRDDRALANLYARQLADEVTVGAVYRRSVWTRQLEAIQRIAAQLTRLASVEAVGAAICREMRQVMEYDEAHVLLLEDDGSLLGVAAVAGPLGEGQPAPLPTAGAAGDAIHRAVESGSPLLLAECVDPSPDRPGAWSMLIVPMRYDRRVSGVITLLKEQVGGFDDDDLRLLQILADQAAVAIENAKLLAGRDELVRELNALLDISRTASQPVDELGLARQLAAKLRAASRLDACVISRWEEGSTTLRTLVADGIAAPPTTDILDLPATRAVLRSAAPRVVQAGAADDASPEALALAELGGQTLVMLPLTVAGRAIGLIELLSLGSRRVLGKGEMQAYQTMAGSIAAGLENQRLLERLRVAADVDQVTGVNNHRYLQDRLRQEVARAARSRNPLCVLMLDLDSFKPVNDRFGHADGDRVLRSVAATIRTYVRTNDIVARYGGDEFVVLMPDTPGEQAQEVARRVVNGIAARRHELSDGAEVRVWASAGLAVYPDDGRAAAVLLQAADANMYAAKRSRKPTLRSRPEAVEPALVPSVG
jgi:diguanylate cyclase (GGDEF)-like protein